MMNPLANTAKTGWDMSLFNYNYGYLTYGKLYSRTDKFVARFKYSAQKRRKNAFVKFLVANFTPEEYFQRIEKNAESPLSVLESKGYSILN